MARVLFKTCRELKEGSMKKKVIATMLCLATAGSLLAGCGGSSSKNNGADADTAASEQSQAVSSV